MQRQIAIAAVSLAIVAGGAWWLSQPGEDAALLPMAANAQETAEGADGAEQAEQAEEVTITEMVQGDPDAAVEVIEYASFTCPHCATFHGNQYQQIKTDYIDTGKIRFVYREVYFNNDRAALWASMLARCGGEERFFGITELLYEQQRTWLDGETYGDIAQNLMQIGAIAGLSEDELGACFSDADKAGALIAWYTENRATHDIEGTPSFIIDGQKYSNMSYGEFAEILDEKLADAEG